MSVYRTWATIDLESCLLAGVQSANSSAWWPLWDLPVGGRHGQLVRVIVQGGLACIEGVGEESLARLRAEFRGQETRSV